MEENMEPIGAIQEGRVQDICLRAIASLMTMESQRKVFELANLYKGVADPIRSGYMDACNTLHSMLEDVFQKMPMVLRMIIEEHATMEAAQGMESISASVTDEDVSAILEGIFHACGLPRWKCIMLRDASGASHHVMVHEDAVDEDGETGNTGYLNVVYVNGSYFHGGVLDMDEENANSNLKAWQNGLLDAAQAMFGYPY